MKNRFQAILISALTTVAIFGVVIYTSCNKDRCKTIVCAYGGVCNDGVCTCRSGYEGPTCETIARNKFLGEWTVFEKGSLTNKAQYPIKIQPGIDITDVVIINLYNYFFSISLRGSVINDTLYIPNQQYLGKVVFGVGFIYSENTYTQYGAIAMRYEVIDTATQTVNDFGFNEIVDHSKPSIWNK